MIGQLLQLFYSLLPEVVGCLLRLKGSIRHIQQMSDGQQGLIGNIGIVMVFAVIYFITFKKS